VLKKEFKVIVKYLALSGRYLINKIIRPTYLIAKIKINSSIQTLLTLFIKISTVLDTNITL